MYIFRDFEIRAYIYAEKYVRWAYTCERPLHDVDHHRSLSVEGSRSLAICTRPQGGVRWMGKSSLLQTSACTRSIQCTAEEDPPQFHSHTTPFHQSGKDSVQLLSLTSWYRVERVILVGDTDTATSSPMQ